MNKPKITADKQLYELLSRYANIMEKVKLDYKSYTPRTLDEQLGRLYIIAYRTRYGYPPVLHDWGCNVCVLNNWRAFTKYYDEVLVPEFAQQNRTETKYSKKQNGKRNKTN